MSNIELKINAVVKMDGCLYRIIDISSDSMLLINIELDRFDIQRVQLDCVYSMLEQKQIEEAGYSEPQFPVDKLTEYDLEKLQTKQKIIEDMLMKLYPYWEDLQRNTSKDYIQPLCDELDLQKKAVFRLVRRYLQSGRNMASLMDQRKNKNSNSNGKKPIGGCVTGPKINGEQSSMVLYDEELEARFNEFYQEFVLFKEKGGTIKSAYEHMIGKYYTNRVCTENGIHFEVRPKSERPSYGRFLRYCNERLGNQTVRQVKKGARSVRNDERFLLGNSQSGCSYPGQILEIDEVEIDMMNVAESDDRQIVGRAVMYTAIDVYSCCIVAAWVDYHNNSFVGITNLFLTLLEEHKIQIEPYGIVIPKELYPSCFLPAEVRVDQGSEYVSKAFRRMGKELGISIVLVAPGTGSLKGIVEQSFHQFQELLRTESRGTGIILKRVDSRHYETACTDLNDMRSIAYQFVSYYNQHRRDGYPYSKEMIESGIIPTPAGLWAYGVGHCAKPRMITDGLRPQIRFAMLKDDKTFRCSRAGITYKNLYYYSPYPWLLRAMAQTGGKTVKLGGIRYDPRTTNQVYYMQDGTVYEIPINENRNEQKGFKNLTWEQYEDFYKQKKKLLDDYENADLNARLTIRETMGNTLETAKKMQEKGKNKKVNIREARKKERAEVAKTDQPLLLSEETAALDNLEPEVIREQNQKIELPEANNFDDMDVFFDRE